MQQLNLKKIVITSVIINIILILIVIFFTIYGFLNIHRTSYNIDLFSLGILINLILVTVIINSLFMFKNLYCLGFNKKEDKVVYETLEQLEKLNYSLRSQRHDFMNHLQVVYSLMELKEYCAAEDYIERTYLDIQKINKALKTSIPAVNALLQAKIIYSEKKNICMKLNVNTRLSELNITSWDLCKVLGNLIDNAIFALEGIHSEKYITIDIFEDFKSFGFKVTNNGPQIPSSILNKIFDAGFTTKGDKGDGMGLAISREVLRQSNGDIKVSSSEKSTEFYAWIPK